MPVRWPIWVQAAVSCLVYSTVSLVIIPAPEAPWPARIFMWACFGVAVGGGTAAGLAASQRRAFGERLTAGQRAQVEAIVRGRATSNDPRLWRAAFSLAREWTSRNGSPVAPALIAGVGVVVTGAAAIVWRPQFWVLTGVFVLAGPWLVWLAARNRAVATLFLTTASPPPPGNAWVPWVN